MPKKKFSYPTAFLLRFPLSIALASFLLVLPCQATPANNQGQMLEMVVASVDGDPITTNDLKKFMARQGSPDLRVTGDDNRVRKFLRDLIAEKLIEKEAQGLNISVSDDDVAQYIREVQAQNHVDEAGFAEVLKGQGLTLEEYRNEIRREIIRARVVSSRVRSKINVVDEDVDRFLKEHPDRIPGANKVHIEQIVVRVAPDASDADIQKAQEEASGLQERVVAGGSFAEVGAQRYLDLGFVSVDELKPDLQAAASQLSVGQVSPVVQDGSSYVILRVAEKSEEGVASAGIRDEIRKELFENGLTAGVEKFINDELPSKYSVEVKL